MDTRSARNRHTYARWENDAVALDIKAARPYPALFALPWSVPLEQWPEDQLAALPRGISRHIVRFARVDGRVLAVKEIKSDIALREYNMLKQLRRRPGLRGIAHAFCRAATF